MATWQFADGGGLARQEGIAAPTYNDVFTQFLGQNYMTGYDPALAQTMGAGGAGAIDYGLSAFLGSGHNGNSFQAANDSLEGRSPYQDADMKGLASGLGIDVGDRTGTDLQQYLQNNLGDYYGIGGMSAGWNPTGDPRQGNYTIYKRENGKLVPYQTSNVNIREKGSWLEENPGILAPIAVATGGLAYGALAGAGAGTAAGGAAATSGAGAGAGGAAGASAAGATGAGTAGISGSIANALGLGGWWGGLPAWGQGAVTGALQGGLSSGLQGQNILKGALMGGLTGGVGAAGGQWLSGATGLPAWASRGIVSAGLGGLSGGWQGALGAGLGSLATTGLGEMGLPSGLASRLGGLAGRVGAGALTSSGGSAGGSGGVGMSGGAIAASSSGGTGAGGGLAGGWRRQSATDAATASYLKQAYAPIAAETQRKRLGEELAEAW